MTGNVAIQRAADALVAARRDGRVLAGLPDEFAAVTLADAYAVQDAILDRIGPVGAWKVGAKPGGEPRCAPLPRSAMQKAGAHFFVPSGGFEIEVETAFTFGKDVPGGRPSAAAVLEAIGTAHLAIELVGSRFVDRRALPPLHHVADLQSNAAVVLGPPVPHWREKDFAALDVRLLIDGQPVPGSPKNAGLAETAECLAWLAAHAAGRGRPILPGTVVITGARLGPTPLGNGRRLVAECVGFGDAAAIFSP